MENFTNFKSPFLALTFDFDSKKHKIAALQKLTPQIVREAFQTYFYGENKRVDIELVGTSHAESYVEELK
jgi:hypothetical protein